MLSLPVYLFARDIPQVSFVHSKGRLSVPDKHSTPAASLHAPVIIVIIIIIIISILVIIIIIITTRFSCQEARCVLQTSCSQRLPQSYPLLDSPDPSKTQSTVGTVLSICTAPRQPRPCTSTLIESLHWGTGRRERTNKWSRGRWTFWW